MFQSSLHSMPPSIKRTSFQNAKVTSYLYGEKKGLFPALPGVNERDLLQGLLNCGLHAMRARVRVAGVDLGSFDGDDNFAGDCHAVTIQGLACLVGGDGDLLFSNLLIDGLNKIWLVLGNLVTQVGAVVVVEGEEEVVTFGVPVRYRSGEGRPVEVQLPTRAELILDLLQRFFVFGLAPLQRLLLSKRKASVVHCCRCFRCWCCKAM